MLLAVGQRFARTGGCATGTTEAGRRALFGRRAHIPSQDLPSLAIATDGGSSIDFLGIESHMEVPVALRASELYMNRTPRLQYGIVVIGLFWLFARPFYGR